MLDEANKRRGSFFIAVLIIATYFIVTALFINRGNALWLDEIFSLWASDPASPLSEQLKQRILPDTNLPAFYVLLYSVRQIVHDDRMAFLALNFILAAFASVLIIRQSLREQTPGRGAIALTLLLCSGPLLTYIGEGRAYAGAIAFSGALAFQATALVACKAGRHDYVLLAIGAGLAACTHIFGMLFSGSIGLALVLLGFIKRRRDLAAAGALVCAATGAVFVCWMIVAWPYLIRSLGDFWIVINIHEISWFVAHVGLGGKFGAAALLGLVVILWRGHVSRDYLILTTLTLFLFIAIPALISLRTPLLLGRYLIIGVPAGLIMVASGAIASATGMAPKLDVAKRVLATFCLLAVIVSAPSVAQEMTDRKPIWRGAPIVRRALETCKHPALRVPSTPYLYAYALSLPSIRIIDSRSEGVADVSSAPCEVIGWGEHIRTPEWAARHDLSAALEVLQLTNVTQAPLQLLPHDSGFVLLRAGALDPRHDSRAGGASER